MKHPIINKILTEWSYRLDDGIIDLENYKHLSILREVLSDMEISSEVIIEVMSNITEEEKKAAKGLLANWSPGAYEKALEEAGDNLENLFPKQQDKNVASSILYLCRNKDNIDNFNKKALYIMIREMTDVKTSKITQISNVFRKIYPKIQEEILSKGHLDNLYNTGSL